jgi:hypothetical protein
MDRRNVLKSLFVLPLLQWPTSATAARDWVMLGTRNLNPNAHSITFVLKNEIAGMKQLGVEVRGNSLWLYDFNLCYPNGIAKVHPINLNIPPTSGGCSSRLNILQISEHPKEVVLNFACLPLTRKSTKIILWGSA